MPDIRQVLRDEIQRLARKEVRDALAGLQRESRELRKTIAELRRRLAVLEKAGGPASVSRRSAAAAPSLDDGPNASVDESALGARISSKMIKRMRERLDLTQAALATLLGVSAQTVYQWERKNGPLQLRGRTRAAVVEVRSLGKREAMRRLSMVEADGGADDAPDADPAPAAPKARKASAATKPKRATKRTRK